MACTDNVMRALFLLALFCVMHGEKEESKRIDAKASGPGGSFDITKLGASGNGKIDNTKAVQEAWASACGDTGKQTILIPKGDFLVGQLNFTGPCKGDVTIHVDGNLLSTMDLSQYKEHGNWMTSTSSIAAPTTRPWLYARTPRAAPRVASRSLHASRPSVD
ncbi:Pectin lyase-like superfamily protein [Zea mays]|uniref:Pectin lyase-like superfamily protein n=1 Tax=Zea mays TaxID=4577 RepID=A0A1D6LRM5_MAIZE|nr:Pectin lyase-like superfamily protein [Zea mays]